MRLSSLFFLLFFSGSLLTQSSGPEWLDSEHRKSNYSSNEYLVGFAKKELKSKKNKSKVLKSLRSQAESKMLDNFFTDIHQCILAKTWTIRAINKLLKFFRRNSIFHFPKTI